MRTMADNLMILRKKKNNCKISILPFQVKPFEHWTQRDNVWEQIQMKKIMLNEMKRNFKREQKTKKFNRNTLWNCENEITMVFLFQLQIHRWSTHNDLGFTRDFEIRFSRSGVYWSFNRQFCIINLFSFW